MNRLESRVDRLEKQDGANNPIMVMICRVNETKEACWERQHPGSPMPAPDAFNAQVFLHIE